MMSGNYTSIDDQIISGSVPAVANPANASVKFTESSLQTFPPADTQVKISGASRPPQDADVTFSKPTAGSAESEPSGWLKVFSVATYKPFFDVDTSEVLERIRESLFPWKGGFTEMISNNPDLYGPFWICTTLILIAASMGTVVTYVAHRLQHKEWNYDISLMTWSAGLFYGYVAIVPVWLYFILKYFSAPSGLVQLWCLYGYSLFVFIPAMCLSAVPVEVVRWIVAGVAGLMSASFVAINLKVHITSAGERWSFIVAAIFLLQIALAVVLKIYLFTVTL